MKLNEVIEKLKGKKFLFIILLFGIVLMFASGKSEKSSPKKRIYEESANKIEAGMLEKTLKEIKGVEKCNVFITYEDSGKYNYAYDVSSGNNKQLEIKLSDDEPLVESVDNPEVRGIFVYIKGYGIASDEITRIIKAATGTPMHRIYVKISEEE